MEGSGATFVLPESVVADLRQTHQTFWQSLLEQSWDFRYAQGLSHLRDTYLGPAT
jgi:hypothetical protein